MSRLTDEQIARFADQIELAASKRLIRFARAIESAVLNALKRADVRQTDPNWIDPPLFGVEDDSSGAVGKGVQPPDGTTEQWLIAVFEHDRMRLYGPGYRTRAEAEQDAALPLARGQRVEVWRAIREAVCAEPSMSTTSPPAGSLSSGSSASGEGVQAPDGEHRA